MWAHLALFIVGASGMTNVSSATIAPDQTIDPASAALAILDFGQSESRMTIPVRVSDRGPFGFIVDTGAERSVVSHELADALDLPTGPEVRLTSMASISSARTVHVPSLQFGNVETTEIMAPALNGMDIGAAGLLGIDALQDRSLTIDFIKHRMTISKSKGHHGFAGSYNDIIVTAKRLYGQLIVTNAHYRNIKIAVIIDTGSPISIGNMALRRAMTRAPRSLGPIELTSVTGDKLQVNYAVLDRFEIGTLEFGNMAIGFADAQPFKKFHLEDTPAMLLGMDTLKLFKHVVIDFKNKTILFDLPAPESHL